MGKLSCDIHAQGLIRNVLQSDRVDYDNRYEKTMMSKLRAGLQILLQMYIVKMGIFNNTVAIQGSSVANTFYLQIEGGQDLFKGGYG